MSLSGCASFASESISLFDSHLTCDLLCSNQFRLDEDNSNDLDKVFTMRLQGLPADGGMIAMLDCWRQSVPHWLRAVFSVLRFGCSGVLDSSLVYFRAIQSW